MSSLTEQTTATTGNKSRVYTIDDILGRRSSAIQPAVSSPPLIIGKLIAI